MKRSELRRKPSALARSPLRTKRKPRPVEPGREAWVFPHAGCCACCGVNVPHLERHHLIAKQAVRREGRPDLVWDLRNSVLLSPHCHSLHTNAVRRLPVALVSEAARAFAAELFGEAKSDAYFARTYAPTVAP